MATSNPYAGFEVGALKGILDAAGVKYPSDASQKTLASLVQDTENAVGKAGFAQIIAGLNGVNAQAPSGGGGSTATHRSITPGTSTRLSSFPGLGLVYSETWNPPTPLEYGRTVA
jgi:hypothetical protein